MIFRAFRGTRVKTRKRFIVTNDVEVYLFGPGVRHRLSGKPTSTIAFEKRWNPMPSMPLDAFVNALATVPTEPAEIEAILAFNRGET